MSDNASSNELAQYAFRVKPQFEEQERAWTARYPHQDWWVSAGSQDEALQRLKDELMRRQNADELEPEYVEEVYRRHLREPVPGVYAMDNDLYVHLLHGGASQADLERVFVEAEKRRRAGEPYTIDDYLSTGSTLPSETT